MTQQLGKMGKIGNPLRPHPGPSLQLLLIIGSLDEPCSTIPLLFIIVPPSPHGHGVRAHCVIVIPSSRQLSPSKKKNPESQMHTQGGA